MGGQGIAAEQFVVTFRDESATNNALVGGKGANLGRLFDAGLPVPGGFCVTTATYRKLLDEDLRRAIDELETLDPSDTETLAASAGEIRTGVRERQLSDEVTDADLVRNEAKKTMTSSKAPGRSRRVAPLARESFALPVLAVAQRHIRKPSEDKPRLPRPHSLSLA